MQEPIKVIKQVTDPFSFETNGDEEYYTVKGFATTYNNVDLVGDEIAKGAFSESLKNKKYQEPVMLWQHDHTQPVGKGFLTDSDEGVLLTAKIPKNDDFVKNRLIPQLQVGAIKSFSVGMFIDTDTLRFEKDRTIINKAAIYETSFVTFPANPKASITSVKSLFLNEKTVEAYRTLPLADDDTGWASDEAIKRIREFTKSTESPSAEYRKAFLYFDLSNSDNFTAYKLPFADVVDGELKAVPRALSAAVGAINGARGGLTDVPDSDLQQIKTIINNYYKRMGKSDPFSKKSLIIDDVKKFTTKREIENCLRESGVFSKSASVYLASCFDLKQSEFAENQNPLLKTFEAELLKLNKLI
jgi:HK97 family phage prohead protease